MSDERKSERQQESDDTWRVADTGDGRDDPGPRYTEEDLPAAGAGSLTPSFLAEIRGDPSKRSVLLVVAAVLGLGFAWIHWSGLFVAGALVGLVSKTVPRATFAALVVAVLVLVLHVGVSPVMGSGEFLALSPPSYVAIAGAFFMPLWGSLVRGVV